MPVRYASNDLNQLRRCSSSVPFNIGEGALRRHKREKLQFYNIALGSVGECNAVFTVLASTHPNKKLVQHGRELCQHIAALLTNLIASVEERYK
ncbi:MAG: four helix bundle protein [Gemmatimonadota bacterium]